MYQLIDVMTGWTLSHHRTPETAARRAKRIERRAKRDDGKDAEALLRLERTDAELTLAEYLQYTDELARD